MERLSNRVSDPSAKLRFIKHTLEAFERKPSYLRETFLLRRLTLYYVAAESFAELRWRSEPISFKPQPFIFFYRIRYLLVAVTIVTLSTGLAGVGWATYHGGRTGWIYLVGLAAPMPTLASPASGNSPDYGDPRLGPAPEEVWLVEKDDEGELWSNGLRVLTVYQSETEKRSYVIISKDENEPVEFHDKPVGIVFHTSEFDIAPFRSGFNTEILRTSRGLLSWIAKRDFYNYFIDRFGQVYRLVIDSDVASHAGMSIWADDEYLYLNISDSFIGICFESRWDPEARGDEILTPAQIQAGLNLIDMLRAQYKISDENCVPHGLVSINPKKMLIGYHTDWAKGFPFGVFDLTDKYTVPLPSITEFGFGYDEHLRETLKGEIWPGVKLAEIELAAKAEEEGVTLPQFRKQLHRKYRRQIEVLKLAKVNPSPIASAHPQGRYPPN